jgi:hypothetical protein
MKRRLFNVAALASLALCAAALGLWARSYWRWDGLSFDSQFRSDFSQYSYKVESRAGIVLAQRSVSRFDTGDRAWWTRPGRRAFSEPAGNATFDEVLRRHGRRMAGFDPHDPSPTPPGREARGSLRAANFPLLPRY